MVAHLSKSPVRKDPPNSRRSRANSPERSKQSSRRRGARGSPKPCAAGAREDCGSRLIGRCVRAGGASGVAVTLGLNGVVAAAAGTIAIGAGATGPGPGGGTGGRPCSVGIASEAGSLHGLAEGRQKALVSSPSRKALRASLPPQIPS